MFKIFKIFKLLKQQDDLLLSLEKAVMNMQNIYNHIINFGVPKYKQEDIISFYVSSKFDPSTGIENPLKCGRVISIFKFEYEWVYHLCVKENNNEYIYDCLEKNVKGRGNLV